MTSNTPGSENVCNFLPLSCSYDTSEFAHLPAAAARLAHVQRSCGSGAWILVVPTHGRGSSSDGLERDRRPGALTAVIQADDTNRSGITAVH